MKSFTAIEVAKQFLLLAQKSGNAAVQDISNMKLQKLVFFAHLVSLMVDPKAPLVSDAFHAWDYGPVEPKLYRLIKGFGAKLFSLSDAQVASVFKDVNNIEDEKALEIINAVWEKFKTWTGVEMSELTHRRNSPWSITYTADRYGVIDNSIICKYTWGEI